MIRDRKCSTQTADSLHHKDSVKYIQRKINVPPYEALADLTFLAQQDQGGHSPELPFSLTLCNQFPTPVNIKNLKCS